jgi:deoxyribodipyrimidine photo-lyase
MRDSLDYRRAEADKLYRAGRKSQLWKACLGVFVQLGRREQWKPEKLSLCATGRREGWWNMSANAENFLGELITGREVGLNFDIHRRDYDQYESLPDWAKKSLQERAKDQHKHVYSRREFESAKTHDSLWSAPQQQLVQEGIIHNDLRMLWGKKVLEWSRTPQEAAENDDSSQQ